MNIPVGSLHQKVAISVCGCLLKAYSFKTIVFDSIIFPNMYSSLFHLKTVDFETLQTLIPKAVCKDSREILDLQARLL